MDFAYATPNGDTDPDDIDQQRSLQDAGLAILGHTGRETPEIMAFYRLIRVSVLQLF